MDKIRLSIITATFNSEVYLERCINSVLNQTYKAIEHIIIDGKSTDTTCKIVEKYKQFIHCFVSEPDNGLYSAFNKGIKRATGDYIFFLNSDDKLHDEKVLEDVVNMIMQNNFPKVLYGKVFAYEENSGYSFVNGKPASINDFIYKMNFLTPSAFIKRSVYSEIGFYDEQYKISSDYDWAIRLFKKYSNNELIFYDRIITDFSVGGTSNKYYRKAYHEVAIIIKNHFPINTYMQHLLCNKWILFKMSIVVALRNTFFLKLYRQLKRQI